MWLLYILYSALRNQYYIGFTGDDILERIRKHNSNHKGFTGNSGDWKLMYQEEFNLKADAIKREKQLKSWKSKKLIERFWGANIEAFFFLPEKSKNWKMIHLKNK